MSSQAVSNRQNNWVLGTFHERGPSGEFKMNGKPLLQAGKGSFDYLWNKATHNLYAPITKQQAAEKAKEIAKWNGILGLASSATNVWLTGFHVVRQYIPTSLTEGNRKYFAIGAGVALMGLSASTVGSSASAITKLALGFGFGLFVGKQTAKQLKAGLESRNQLALGTGVLGLAVTAWQLGFSLSPIQWTYDFAPVAFWNITAFAATCFVGNLLLPSPVPGLNQTRTYLPAKRSKECLQRVLGSLQFARASYAIHSQINARPLDTLIRLVNLDSARNAPTATWRQVFKQMNLTDLFRAVVYDGLEVSSADSEGIFPVGTDDERIGDYHRFKLVSERPVE